MSVVGERELPEYWGKHAQNIGWCPKRRYKGETKKLKWSSESRQTEQQPTILEEPSEMHENNNSLREWEYYFIKDLLYLQVNLPEVLGITY